MKGLNSNLMSNVDIIWRRVDRYGFLEIMFKCRSCGYSGVLTVLKNSFNGRTFLCNHCEKELKVRDDEN